MSEREIIYVKHAYIELLVYFQIASVFMILE